MTLKTLRALPGTEQSSDPGNHSGKYVRLNHKVINPFFFFFFFTYYQATLYGWIHMRVVTHTAPESKRCSSNPGVTTNQPCDPGQII